MLRPRLLARIAIPVLLVVLLGCGGAGVSGPPGGEEEAIATVERLQGRFERDGKAPGKPVVEVWVDFKEVTTADLESLTELSSLRTLSLSGTDLGDKDLRLLARLPKLRTLYLFHTPVTDAGLAVCKRLPDL